MITNVPNMVTNTTNMITNAVNMVTDITNMITNLTNMFTVTILFRFSKRIAILGSDEEDGLSPKQALLQKSIRVYASNFMQENMMGLQNLPTEEQYCKLQEKRTTQIQKQIAMERQATFHAQEQERRITEKEKHGPSKEESVQSGSKQHQRSSSYGWKPAEQTVTQTITDPMLQQMEIIKGYIKQAREAQKWDEVNMLEQNLKDLHLAYSSQQKETWSS